MIGAGLKLGWFRANGTDSTNNTRTEKRRIRRLVQKLASKDEATRIDAQKQLLDSGSAAGEVLIGELEREIRNGKRLPLFIFAGVVCQVLLYRDMLHRLSAWGPFILITFATINQFRRSRNESARIL